jgi:hypothetical protein
MYSCTGLVYGTIEEYTSCQDIWVLTIPGFHWFRIRTDRTRRAINGHGCHVVGKQLVTVAGMPFDRMPYPDRMEHSLCMNTPFRVFDLEKLEVG